LSLKTANANSQSSDSGFILRSFRYAAFTTAQTAQDDGDNAKLEWPVSIDGKKKQGETYKIIGILTKIIFAPDKFAGLREDKDARRGC
jgi:hypothetical protein